MAPVDIDALVSQLTIEEKVSLLAGESMWRTAAIERLGIPGLKVSDGPSGARGETFGNGVAAAFLPSGVSLGATWDEDLVFELSQLLAEEAKTKSASVALAPTVCLHRHPLGGRNFEAYSEDPYLTGKLGSASVRGLQSKGIGATPKHFAANEQETRRYKTNVNISPRALRETYLLPFQMMVREANPWCLMTAYNKVNGHHCDASKEMLIDIARKEWKWDGLFMSDWGGTTSTIESINNGLDLEMPGPPARRQFSLLEKPIKDGLVDLDRVDESCARLLKLLERANRFNDDSDHPEFCKEDPDTAALLRRAGSAGIVMLKNDNGALPLKPVAEKLRKIAVVGPNAERVVAGGGGSAYITAPYWTSVLGSLKDKFNKEEIPTEIIFSTGSKVNRFLPTIPLDLIRNPDTGKNGAAIDWHQGHDLSENRVAQTHIEDLYYISFGTVPSEVGREADFSFRVRLTLTPRTTGRHKFSLASMGPSQLYVDGEKIAEQSGVAEERGPLFFTYGSKETIASLDLVEGKEYQIVMDYLTHDRQLDPAIKDSLLPMEDKFQGIRLGYEEFDDADRPAEAARVAQDCEAAIVVVGRDREWETEGQDTPMFELPGEQVRLIQEVAAVCKRTIVLVQSGSPVQMHPWVDDVQSVLYVWYQGQELGNAALDVLLGDVNPSGRLPMTFPRRIEDSPAFSSFPGENDETYYSEGIYVGYKWWDLTGVAPLYPIGFGLSYNTFDVRPGSISTTKLLGEDTTLTLSAHVRNAGGSDIPGRQTLVAWFSQSSEERLSRPRKQICGFAKSKSLSPGEEDVVEIKVNATAFGLFDTKKGTWIIDNKSEFDILLGTNAGDVVPAWRVSVPQDIAWV